MTQKKVFVSIIARDLWAQVLLDQVKMPYWDAEKSPDVAELREKRLILISDDVSPVCTLSPRPEYCLNQEQKLVLKKILAMKAGQVEAVSAFELVSDLRREGFKSPLSSIGRLIELDVLNFDNGVLSIR